MFKVGDRVRCIESKAYSIRKDLLVTNEVYTIINITKVLGRTVIYLAGLVPYWSPGRFQLESKSNRKHRVNLP